jgi:translation initiation factor IF-2
MQEVLSPTPEGEYVGAAVVQEVFNIGGTGNIAGSKCKDGIIRKGSNVRILRGDKILAESKVKTLRNFKVCFGFANGFEHVIHYIHANFLPTLVFLL